MEDIEIAELNEIRLAHNINIIDEFRTGMKEEFSEHLRELVTIVFDIIILV